MQDTESKSCLVALYLLPLISARILMEHIKIRMAKKGISQWQWHSSPACSSCVAGFFSFFFFFHPLLHLCYTVYIDCVFLLIFAKKESLYGSRYFVWFQNIRASNLFCVRMKGKGNGTCDLFIFRPHSYLSSGYRADSALAAGSYILPCHSGWGKTALNCFPVSGYNSKY